MTYKQSEIDCVEALIEQITLEYYRDNPSGDDMTPIEFASRVLKRIVDIIDTINAKRLKN